MPERLIKVLFVATYGDFLSTFEYSNIQMLKELGCEVHCASNFKHPDYNQKKDRLKELQVVFHEVDFSRKPLKKQNITAYRELIKIIKNEEIDVVDCHNAIVGVFARLAAAHCKVKYVIYTAHGFAFYDGCKGIASKIFYVVERIMARKTNLLITINKEDFQIAQKKMKVKDRVQYIPGVGVKTYDIAQMPSKREKFCKELNIPINAKILLMVGELIPRKNHETILRALSEIKEENVYLVLCGIGQLSSHLKRICEELEVSDRVRFAGYRTDVKDMMRSFDIFVFPSFQEGLPVALMEAMAAGMPCVVSDIRGNRDLIINEKGGFLFSPSETDQAVAFLKKLLNDSEKCRNYGEYNQIAIKPFDIENIRRIMWQNYKKIIENVT